MVQATGAGALLALVMTVLAFVATPRDPSQWRAMIAILVASYGATFFCWRTLPDCDAHIEVGDEFIAQHWPHKPSVTLVWSQINRVKNNRIMQRLELYNTTMDARVTVEHQVENFGELRAFILSKLPPAVASS